jgi:light-regulated signal transduction histidine kinase (bacteriophytochrome)
VRLSELCSAFATLWLTLRPFTQWATMLLARDSAFGFASMRVATFCSYPRPLGKWQLRQACAFRSDGLGLAIVSEIMKAHRGSVRVGDNPGAGRYSA